MRLLADHPSMDFLRREAKEMLTALRESTPTAALADAQRALAAEYGFKSWNELKSDVERRRNALPAAPDGLAAGLSESFALGAVTAPMTPIRYEYTGRRWCLETDKGRFLVTPVFDWVCDATQSVGVDLMERARKVGVLAPTPVRTPAGGLVRRVLDQNWRVDEWIDLGPTPGLPLESSVAHSLGSVLAAVHSVAPPTDQPIVGAWVADRPSDESWATLAERARNARKPWADEFAALAPVVAELSKITAPEARAVIIGNRDIQPGTVRFGPGDQLVVTHWDFAGPTTKETELALLLAQSALQSPAVAGSLMEGYRERAGGDAPPLTLASFAGHVTGWLTWANHRACDALSEPTSAEQADFAERSVREVLDDPLTVRQLTELLDAATT